MPINPPRTPARTARAREIVRGWSLLLTRYGWLTLLVSWTSAVVALMVVSGYPEWHAVLLGYALGLLAAANASRRG